MQKEEILVLKVQGILVYDRRVKGFKKRDRVQNVWKKMAENLDFAKYFKPI